MAVDIMLSVISILGNICFSAQWKISYNGCTEYEQLVRSHINLDEQGFQSNIVNIFLPISFNLCFGCSKEPSH